MKNGVDEKIGEDALRWFGHVEIRKMTGLLRESMQGSVLVVPQWVGRERGGLTL